MSVPSLKTSVTAERPNLETERASSRPGRPLMASSTGVVMNRSTSSGPRAGALVRTCTCTLVTSGTASMGRVRIAARPPPARRSDPTNTRNRFPSDHSRMRSIMTPASFLATDLVLLHLGLERERAAGDDGLPLGQALDDLEPPAALIAHLDGSRLELVLPH